jgi:hypothetical protein
MTTANATQGNKAKKSYVERAEDVKKFLQVIIAIGILILLILKLLYHLGIFPIDFVLNPLLAQKTLQIVGECLAFSAAVDLAYMLLTPGPDEAIEPLILGLASAILFSISRIDERNITLAFEIGLYVLVLAILFIMKALFIEDDKGTSQWDILITKKKK